MNRVSRLGKKISRIFPLFCALAYFISWNQMLSFPELSVSAINCNSLNMSAITSYHQTLKIHGIVQLRTDIIFLSDIRLGSKSSITVLKKMFQTNPYGSYEFYYNSSTSSRGVGILIKTNLNVSVRAEARDSSENILALRIQHKVQSLLYVLYMDLINHVRNSLPTLIIYLVMLLSILLL